MSYGFLARSSDNAVLISSDVEHLHFQGKPAVSSATVKNSAYGGCTVFTYSAAIGGTPIFFIKQDGRLSAIVRLTGTSGNWVVTLIREGTDTTPPVLLAFTQPSHLTPTGTVGMRLKNRNGVVTFDSRLQPLVTSSATYTTPNTVPPNSGVPPTSVAIISYGTLSNNPPILQCDWNFSTSGTRRTYAVPAVSNPIVSAYSTGQACYERKRQQYWQESNYASTEYHWRLYLWWCFYREAVSVSPVGVLTSGWVPYRYGRLFSEYEETVYLGGLGGVSQKWEAVAPPAPFRQKTANLRNNIVIIADGSAYI